MCQIQIIKKINGKLTERDNKEFIQLMSLGNQRNYDAFGIFNHNHLMKVVGSFDYKLMNERKIKRDKFIVGHNRFTTIGECVEYQKEILIPSPVNTFNQCNPWISFKNLWKNAGKEEEISKNYNNHPFKIGELLLVHNGTIYNYKKLKRKYKIQTEIETDSYVILALINHFLKESQQKDRVDKIVDAIKRTTNRLGGNYSVILYDKKTKNMFYFRSEYTSFTFHIIGKDLIIGSSNEKNLNYTYKQNKLRRRIPTFPGEIYLVGNEIKKIGEFKKCLI